MGLKKNNKKQYVLYDGDVVLEFDEAKHVYTLQPSGLVVPSTTAITKVIDKPALVAWSANETAEYARKILKPGKAYSERALNAILDAAKNARLATSEEALKVGTQVHEWTEEFARRSIAGEDESPPLPRHPHARLACQAFIEWVKEHNVKFIQAEVKVYSRDYHYSGTYDLLAIVDGLLSIVDYKSSKRIYDEYVMQGSAYAYAYEEEQTHLVLKGKIGSFRSIEQVVILRLPKDGGEFQSRHSTDIDYHFEVFRHCRAIYDFANNEGVWSNRHVRTRERSNRFFLPLGDVQGWGYPNNRSLSAHYFKDGKSLCGKYEWDGAKLLLPDFDDHPNNCKSCTNKKKKLDGV
jgi:hypothetical protein